MTDRTTDHWLGRHYAADHVRGPVAFLNPTTRLQALHRPKSNLSQDDTQAGGGAETLPSGSPPPSSHTGVYTVWRSRDNRKGRHALHLTPSRAGAIATPFKYTNTLSAALAGMSRMLIRWPVWDVSYDVAVVFTLGSIVWVCNGFFVLIPLTNPASSFPGESSWAGGVSAVVGATIFELGSILLMIEAVNENRSECFGWALEQALDRSGEDLLLRKQDANDCRHHHSDKKSFVSSNDGAANESESGEKVDDDMQAKGRKWTWWPSWYELRTHYLRDIGFLACLSQFFGATVFWISGFTGLPQILSVLTVPAENGIYWLPQVVGGTGFIISSWLFMLETQSKWYIPAPTVLGWHIGFWNLIGALGFTLCGAFGFASSSEVYETALTWSTFVGSWAFLIGSLIQWYESLDKYPVIVDKSLPHSTTTDRIVEQGKAQA
ncbi:hypothetical protein N0V93_000392 [Gnomoniopsis smithogilvyi]|uniref:Integral membrane protein n=1 Tax=Gnomoniopsis smithogilvyi TaxID=1191159 RepID=A0A9W8Z1U5_9PEZI|nr:hypothetical protein N0V93_000392 [Gnomoniopsis smithogilvyi]